ncbi:MAG: hypothetical protein LBL16_00610 [Endomicrobium sp.]|jgi:hypothetical protein|nr:hypothetical protein [Endomicrobium sp.]
MEKLKYLLILVLCAICLNACDGSRSQKSFRSDSITTLLVSISNSEVEDALKKLIGELLNCYSFLSINDNISFIRVSLFTASVSQLDEERLGRIVDEVMDPPESVPGDACHNIVAELVKIGEIIRDEDDIDYSGALAISRVYSSMYETDLQAIYSLIEAVSLFHELGDIKQNIITTDAINLSTLNAQLDKIAVIICNNKGYKFPLSRW